MKKETQEAIKKAIVDWLSTHRLIKGEYEIIQRYMRYFYGISLFDINMDALAALWKKSEEEQTIRVGVYGAEDFSVQEAGEVYHVIITWTNGETITHKGDWHTPDAHFTQKEEMIYYYHNSTDMYKVMKDFISQLETISNRHIAKNVL